VHVDARHVEIDGEDTEAVIDDDGVAFVEEVANEDDGAGVGEEDGRGFGSGKVGAGVEAGFLFVEDARLAEAGGGGGGDGLDEIAGPEWMRRAAGVGVLLEDFVLRDLFLFGV